jgi:hypothetical protein
VLDLFDQHGVKATFFVKGVLTEQHTDAVQEMRKRGHRWPITRTPSGGQFLVLTAGTRGQRDRLLQPRHRHGHGHAAALVPRAGRDEEPTVHSALARRGMRLIGWTARGFDAVRSDSREILARILPHLCPARSSSSTRAASTLCACWST